jgi:glutamyl-tRNA synthetase
VRAFAARVDAVVWDKAALNALLKEIVAELSVKMPQVAVPIRVAVTGRAQTPSLDAVLHLFGRTAVQSRLAAVLPRLP